MRARFRPFLVVALVVGAVLAGSVPAAAERPNPPRLLTVTADGAGSLRLDWAAPSDPDGDAIDRYQIFRSTSADPATFTWRAVTSATTWRDTGLQAGVRYHYHLKAIDDTGAISWRNGIVSAVAPGGVDTQRPTVPSDLAVQSAAGGLRLTWTPATDDVGVVHHRVYRATGGGSFAVVARPTGSSWTDTDVSPGTSYRYYLRAVDAAGNVGWRNGIVTATAGAAGSAGLWVVGDMAQCRNLDDEAVGELLATRDGPILALGDVVYPSATAANLRDCFEPAFGAVQGRMWPVVGNHEYDVAGAAAYWDFFGDAAGPHGQGWYERSIAGWQVLVLNSNCWEPGVGGCDVGSEQYRWLAERLAARPDACRIVAWHHPRWSSYATYPDQPFLDPMLQLLHEAGTELVVAGHAHHYERFVPVDPTGATDWDGGMRQFVVGTGGVSLRTADGTAPGSIYVRDTFHGALRLELSADAYTWRFLDVDGIQRDAGSSPCRTN